MKEDHNPSDFQGRSREKYESNGKFAVTTIIMFVTVILIYLLANG